MSWFRDYMIGLACMLYAMQSCGQTANPRSDVGFRDTLHVVVDSVPGCVCR